jgi:hypothetical protein
MLSSDLLQYIQEVDAKLVDLEAKYAAEVFADLRNAIENLKTVATAAPVDLPLPPPAPTLQPIETNTPLSPDIAISISPDAAVPPPAPAPIPDPEVATEPVPVNAPVAEAPAVATSGEDSVGADVSVDEPSAADTLAPEVGPFEKGLDATAGTGAGTDSAAPGDPAPVADANTPPA